MGYIMKSTKNNQKPKGIISYSVTPYIIAVFVGLLISFAYVFAL